MLRDVIQSGLACVASDTLVIDIARLMKTKNIGCVLVVQDDRPIGIVTDRDLVVRCIAQDQVIENCSASDIMSESVRTVGIDDGIFDCIRAMRDARVRRIPVVDEQGKAVGIVSLGDLLAILSKELTFLAEAGTLAADLPDDEKLVA